MVLCSCLPDGAPVLKAAGLRREADAYLVERARIGGVGEGIALLFYLPKGGLHRVVELQLHDVDIVLRLDDDVDAAVAGVSLHVHIEAQELHDDRHAVLEVQLHVTHHLIRPVGEQCLQARHEALDIALLQVADEIRDEEVLPVSRDGRVERHEEMGESLFHFLVRIAQFVHAESLVVALDGEVAALVDEGYGILHRCVEACQVVGCRQFLGEVVQLVVVLLQHLYEEGRRARLEPVVAELESVERIQQAERIV